MPRLIYRDDAEFPWWKQCEVGVSRFDNDQMSEALHWGETMHYEIASVLSLLDGLAEQWGDEGVFRRCRDRLRKLVEVTT